MNDKNPIDWPKDVWIFAVLIAVVGSIISVVNKLRKPRTNPYCFVEMMCEMITSSAVGVVAFMAIYSFDVPMGAAYAGGCMAGHMGTRLIFLFENYITRKLEK